MAADLDNLRFWLDVLWKTGTVLGLLWLALRQQSRENARRLDAHESRLKLHGDELIVIREQMKGYPTHQDLQRLHDRISNVRDEVGKTREDTAALLVGVAAVRKAVDRLQEHHMKLKGQGE